jgi:hypothetical protein
VQRTKVFVSILGLAVLLAACGGPAAPAGDGAGDGGEATDGGGIEAPEVPVGTGECAVRITGDEEAEFTSGGGSSAVGTDYWFADEELAAAEEALGAADQERAENEPVFFTLLINCGFADDPASISLLPGGDSTYDDVPFGPKTYPIVAGGALGGSAEPGQFSVLITFGGTRSFGVSEEGELRITKFDTSGIEGSFSFAAEEQFGESEDPPQIQVEGTFQFDCTGGSKCT